MKKISKILLSLAVLVTTYFTAYTPELTYAKTKTTKSQQDSRKIYSESVSYNINDNQDLLKEVIPSQNVKDHLIDQCGTLFLFKKYQFWFG